MIEEIKIGDKNVLFARHNGKLIYPKYASAENLVLHYDFSGRTNLDVQKEIAEDLSGNGNNGVLQNFGYIDGSGYLDNELIFDGIDDFITIPEPQIDLDNFTYSEGINVLSFRGDEVATVVDGVIEIGGRNLLPNNDIVDGWGGNRFNEVSSYHYTTNVQSTTGGGAFIYKQRLDLNGNHIFQIQVKTNDENLLGKTIIWQSGGKDVSKKPITLSEDWQTLISVPIEGENVSVGLRIVEGTGGELLSRYLKLEKGTVATDWTPAPEDLETTTFKPLFDKKIKSTLFWNRALTDEELLQVYNTQIKRI